MIALQLLNHLLNFMLPALFLALALPWAERLNTRFPKKKRPAAPPFYRQVAIVFVVCLVAQALSLWWTGRDGKMLGYALMVLGAATCQWVFVRGWR